MMVKVSYDEKTNINVRLDLDIDSQKYVLKRYSPNTPNTNQHPKGCCFRIRICFRIQHGYPLDTLPCSAAERIRRFFVSAYSTVRAWITAVQKCIKNV